MTDIEKVLRNIPTWKTQSFPANQIDDNLLVADFHKCEFGFV